MDLFSVRNIIHVPLYQYEDGGTPTPKYVIILHSNTRELYILQALVTSNQKVPDTRQNHGCTNNDYFSFFMFLAGREIGIRNSLPYSFRENTFIYFKDNIRKISYSDCFTKYIAKGINIEYVATLSDEEYKRLIKCARSSKTINREFKREFEGVFDRLG